MFSVEELSSVLESAWFQTGRRELERDILRSRLDLELVSTSGEEQLRSLRRFTGAVLASLAKWENPRDGIARQLCLSAADIEAAFALLHIDDVTSMSHRRHVLRSAVLYDLAGMPGVAATLAQKDGLAVDAKDFFSRSGRWGRLAPEDTDTAANLDSSQQKYPDDGDELVNAALGDVLRAYSTILQNPTVEPAIARSDLKVLDAVVGRYSSFLCRDECSALQRSLQLRSQNATLLLAKTHSSLQESDLRHLELPAEMWPVQRRAVEEGLLSPKIPSFGLAAPTGTGKTALMRLLIADFLERNPEKKAIYVSPSRALTAQVAHELSEALAKVNKKVLALGAHLSLHPIEDIDPESANVLVFTPEKADLIMRILPESLAQVGLVIVDEAHHIEQGTRGILLEFYLWRLRSLVPSDTRFVQLSAVAPNIKDMVGWLGGKKQISHSLTLDWRTSRLRMGVFERRADGSAIVQFGTEAPYILLQRGECPSDPVSNLSMLANRLAERGVVLVLTTSPGAAEKIAAEVAKLRKPLAALGETGERLDARIERELYPEAPLREQLRKRVVYHHAQLPPRVRFSIERCVADRQVDVVCATTTLGEGVNFPFSTVIVDSLVGRGYQLSPRALWNIAGRAGRFGVDSEGHCILFRPSRWKARLAEYSLEDYLRTNLADIPPVRSALANAITDLKEMVEDGAVDFDGLANISLSDIHKKERSSRASIRPVRGLINVMRVGYAHANTSKTISVESDTAPEFQGELLASRQMTDAEKSFAEKLGRQQRRVVRDALREDAELVKIAARIGWALETQQNLYDWLKGLEDWRLNQFGEMVIGGKIKNADRLGYLLGPLSKHMSEFEGESLGGYTSYVAVNWLRGLPLTEIRQSQQKKMDFGRLVAVIYSRIQYMLPWALFGVHELIEYESKRRHIKVGDGVRDLSVLAAEGVPDFDALTLVMRLDIERVDATRLAASYHRARPDTDVVGWLRGLQWERLVGIVRGPDNRRLDPDLRTLWEKLTG